MHKQTYHKNRCLQYQSHKKTLHKSLYTAFENQPAGNKPSQEINQRGTCCGNCMNNIGKVLSGWSLKIVSGIFPYHITVNHNTQDFVCVMMVRAYITHQKNLESCEKNLVNWCHTHCFENF